MQGGHSLPGPDAVIMEKLLAVVAMLANAGKDTIFKVAAVDEGGSTTTLFYGIKAAIIALLSLVILLVQGKPLLHLPTLPWAIPLGVLAMTTYTLALKSLASGDASTSVTVFRLNFVLSSGAAALFLGEAFTATKLAGLGLSLAAILIFFVGSRAEARVAASLKGIPLGTRSVVLAVLACVCASVLNTSNKIALNAGVSILHLIMYRYVVVCIISALWIGKDRGSFVPSRKLLIASASCAVLMLVSMFCALSALAGGDVSVVIPIVSLSFLFTAVLSFVFLHEKLSAMKILGIALAVAGIFIIG